MGTGSYLYPGGSVAFDPLSRNLFVVDFANNRILQFSLIRGVSSICLPGMIGAPYSMTIIATSTHGFGAFLLVSGSLPPGFALNSLTGVISGTPNATGSYSFTIEEEDDILTGRFIDDLTFDILINQHLPAPTGIISSGGGGGSAYYVRINGGVATTATTSITLSLYGTGAYTMEISNSSTFAGAAWQPYVTSLPWVLNSATGTETVYAQFRSVASTTLATVSASISYLPNGTSTPPKSPPRPVKAQITLLQQELEALLAQVSGGGGASGGAASGGSTVHGGTASSGNGPPSESTVAYTFTRNLGLWNTGVDVRELQQILITSDAGSSAAALANHGATAVFGMLTYHALREYQSKAGISATGYFGPVTRRYVMAHE